MSFKQFFTVCLCVVAAISSGGTAAQSYPAKPVRIVSPYPAAGGVDVLARVVAQRFSEALGQQFIVDNRTGASGRIGTEIVAKSPADGYTLLLGTIGPNAIIPAVDPKLSYDAVKDFAPISLIAVSDYMLVVHPSLPVKSVAELIKLARSKPGELVYASTGTLGVPHLAVELMKNLAKIDMVHVPYRGGSPAITAVVSGETSLMFASGLTAMAHVKAGRVRALGVSGAKRSEHYPGMPVVAETLPGFAVSQWYGILAPAGTPANIIALLHAETVKAVASPNVKQQIVNQAADPVHNTPEEFAALIRSDIEKWKRVVKSAKIKAE
jgi:tripartite-type tricarboxylate transporter receptor subunit TctC